MAERGELSALVGVERSGAWWRADVDEGQLRWSDGRPDDETQAGFVDLLRALVAATPPYLGLAVYPFGPAGPPALPASAPYRTPDAGPILFLSERYLKDNPPSGDPRRAAGFRHDDIAGGLLLWAEVDLLQAGDDGRLDHLRHLLGAAAGT